MLAVDLPQSQAGNAQRLPEDPNARASTKPRPYHFAKVGRYLRVRKWLSEYGLSLLTWGRLWDLVTPRSASRWATGLAIIGDPRALPDAHCLHRIGDGPAGRESSASVGRGSRLLCALVDGREVEEYLG